MIADLKPYAEYKESGLPWLGQVPGHWGALSVKQIFDIQLGKMLQNTPRTLDDSSVPYLKAQHVQWSGVRSSDLPQMWASPREVEHFGVRPGDLLVCEGGEGGRCAVLKSIPADVIIQNALHRVRSRSTGNTRFLGHVLAVISSVGWFDAINNKATIAHFTRDKFGALGIPLPPPDEQAAIVRFLDWANGRLERAIRAKRKVIALLNEQKQAIIHRAVTRGLDPSVPLKPSGVPWLGDIPQHWEVVRSGSMFRLFGGYAFPGAGFFRDESDTTLPLLLTPVNFDPEGGLRFGRKSTIRFRGVVPDQFRLQKGSLVTVLTDLSSKRLILGRAGFIGVDGVLLNQRTARVDIHPSVRARLSAEYLCLVLNSPAVREQTIATSRGSTVFHTSPTRMLAARWPLPPIEEQHAIVEKLEMWEREHRGVCDKLRDEIELLREYRTRLVADVVTGKLDVRVAAARLPDEASHDTGLDDTDPDTDADSVDEEAAA